MFARCSYQVPGFFFFYNASTNKCFRGLTYGLQMSKLVICPTCEKLRQKQRPKKALRYLRFNIDWVKTFGCQSDHRSASPGPYIFRYRCLWPGVRFGQYLIFSCTLGITHHALGIRKLTVPNQTSVRRQRRCTATASLGANIP